ncbi:MAG: 50S ribosomal protein L22 [Candidatus Saccharibacteria bacterium]|nr:50S ribosomal protein L22 [Candidatus Saccharibacteria bacterium]
MSDKLTAKAVLSELRLTPRKVSLVAGLVRGRTVEDAIVILNNTPKRAAKPLRKLIESVRANAINNHNMKSEGLRITTLSVTAGPRLKRFRPVSRGMAHPYQKRTSNILVVVSGDAKPAKKAKTEKVVKAEEVKASEKESK